MNLSQFSQNPDGTYRLTCCACGKEIPHGSRVFPDESGWLCPECAEGEPRYAAANCMCGNCDHEFQKAWQIPMNAKRIVPPNKFTCPKCGKREGAPISPAQYYGGMLIEGMEDDWGEAPIP